MKDWSEPQPDSIFREVVNQVCLAALWSSTADVKFPNGYDLASSSQDGDQYYVHTASIKRISSDVRQAMVVTSLGKPDSSGSIAYKEFREFDCGSPPRVRTLKAIYAKAGEAADAGRKTSGTEDWRPIRSPTSVLAGVSRYVCKQPGTAL